VRPPSAPRELDLASAARIVDELERFAQERRLRCPECGETLVVELAGRDPGHFAAACVWCGWPAPEPRRTPRPGWAVWDAAYWDRPAREPGRQRAKELPDG
jgi:hypothetical protein